MAAEAASTDFGRARVRVTLLTSAGRVSHQLRCVVNPPSHPPASWSEPPGANHPISRNASKTQPAKLLAVFVVDTHDKDLTTPVK